MFEPKSLAETERFCSCVFFSNCWSWPIQVKVAQCCPTVCRPYGLYSPWDFPSQNTEVGRLSLLQGIFPRIEPRSPALRANSLPAEPQGRAKNTRVGSLALLQIFPTPGIEPESPALQADSLPTELWGVGQQINLVGHNYHLKKVKYYRKDPSTSQVARVSTASWNVYFCYTERTWYPVTTLKVISGAQR